MSSDLTAHLRYFQELGVDGIHRDPEWRTRAVGDPPAAQPSPHPEAGAPDEPAGSSARPAAGAAQNPARTESASPAAAPVNRQPAPAAGDSRRVLAMLRDEIGPACTRCKLHTLGRTQVVFGVGNPGADLMFVGEGPGADEDQQGEPFVGRAGQLLNKIIESIGLTREQVYIANVVKCRPPGNRNPEPDEVASCEPFLFRQIDAVQPKVIIALGKFAAQSLLRTADPITRLRGRVYNYRGASLIPTFHPAYLLRNPSSKREVWEDMKKARAILRGEQ